MIRYQARKRAEAAEKAILAANQQLRDQVTAFYFKAKKHGVAPSYSSMSIAETEERRNVTRLTIARRLERAEQVRKIILP